MNVYVNVNSDALIKHTNKLEKLRKSDLPVAIRGTLNKAAFHTKMVTMPSSADRFVKRHPNFFKANSKVLMATGLVVQSMRSVIGFVPSDAAYNNKAVEELQQQEYGGKIKRDFIPADKSRVGESILTPVRPKNRLKTITQKLGGDISDNAIHASDMKGANRRVKFLKAAVKAGVGGYVIAGLRKQMLYRIDSVSRKFGRTFIKHTALYSYRGGRSVGIKATSFMREASLTSAKSLNKFYIEEANRRVAKAIK